ncbi:Hypothetical protein UVM_LOCUS186 [uncultured virus]|nr:Hypothetical protein UVM_LOCUS186 [uncultured virus]
MVYERVRRALQRTCLLPMFLQERALYNPLRHPRCGCVDCLDPTRPRYPSTEHLWIGTACFVFLLLPLLALAVYLVSPPPARELAEVVVRVGHALLSMSCAVARWLVVFGLSAFAAFFFCCCTFCGCATSKQRYEYLESYPSLL